MTGKSGLVQGMRQLLLLDGAMGSQLMARGVQIDTCPDYLCIQAPQQILAIHQDYIAAGSDAILTNTFGANPIALARYGLADQCTRINIAAAGLARKAAGADRYVLGDIGPSGQLPEPLGAVSIGQLRQGFAHQAGALVEGGVDGFIIETMTSLEEVMAAVDGIRQSEKDLPILACMAFDATARGFRTMMGVDVASFVRNLVSAGVQAIGFNCGSATMAQYLALADQFVDRVRSVDGSLAIVAEPNAGRPQVQAGCGPTWSVGPDQFAHTLQQVHSKGITVLGGCCGTGPQHIEAAAALLRGSRSP